MNQNYYDIIIIGTGIAGLFSAYNIKNTSPDTSFLILEKYKKEWIGGRSSNEMFRGTPVVTGAGVGRKDKDKLLIKLMNEIGVKYTQFESKINYANTFTPVDIMQIMRKLKTEFINHQELHNKTFKDFFIKTLGAKLYKLFIISSGYTDYENADLYDTLYNYGMEDNKGGWTGLYIPWKNMVDNLFQTIGKNHFRFSSDVVEIKKMKDKPCLFQIKTETGTVYNCNRVVIATTITGIQKLVSHKSSLYKQIHGQTFLRLYAKFNKESTEIMKKYVPSYTIVPGPLQKMIPMDPDKGIYMIAYSDNDSALLQKKYLKNSVENRNVYCDLIEEALGILPKGQLKILDMKDYYWSVGTHYYEPLHGDFKTRKEFIHKAQHPENGILVVGEVVSKNQGWVEGALESVNLVLSKHWIRNEC
jgi:thioredoxin reductase